jgi:hypothetical protein
MKLHQILITDANNAENLLPEASRVTRSNFDGEYVFWDKEKIESFIADHFEKDVLKAFKSLRPYAYKADLARYCILYILGGWYVDVNITVYKFLDINDIDLVVFRDYNNDTRLSPWQLANGFIYSTPGQPGLKIAIDQIVENCKTKYYGKRTLSITGPELFGRSLAIAGWDHSQNRYLIGDFVDSSVVQKQFVVKGISVALHKTLNGGDVGIRGTNSYVDMWHNKDVYEDIL